MIFKNIILTILITTNIAGCVAANKPITTNTPQLPLKEIGTTSCTVDSSLYSSPYLKHSGKAAPVPLRDGLIVTIDASNHPEMRVLIENKSVFRSCYKSTMVIETINQAKKLLKFTKIKDLQKFIGSEVTACTTVDEGWFFLYKQQIGYIGYTGPAELPLSLVGMQCN